MVYTIRPATKDDIKVIQSIEQNAAAKFDSIPELADIAAAVIMPDAKVITWLSNGRIYLACFNDRPIGLISAFPMDTSLLIAEVSVIPEHNGKGVGTTLLNAIFAWAREEGSSGRVSLMTYREIQWNKRWYEGRGFREVDAATIGPKHLEKVRSDREERNLERPGYSRCCMLWEDRKVES